MRPCILVLGVTVLLNVACGSSANVEEERTALLQVDREWSQATKDTEKFLGYFAPDASIYVPGMPVATGAGPIRDTITNMMSMPGFSITWNATKADVSTSGDVGYTTGTYEMTASGMPAPEKGKYVTVWKKSNGQWKVIEDIFNADAGPAPATHAMVAPASITWGDGPPSLPPGAKLAVITGDPSKPGPFVLRVQVPAGYKVPPHWHPGDENLTVLSGTVALGMGNMWDDAKLETLASGGYATLPAEMRHFFLARTASTFQVHGTGPFAVNYANPADDPSRAK
jgi:ketosteroid isomerase-like protein/quercetin dioxygenase-like cupin family protein